MVASTPNPFLEGHSARCWRRSWRRRFARHPEKHAELVVLHGLAGEMRYLIDGRIVTLRAGSLLWAFAGQSHVLLSETPDFDMWVFLIAREAIGEGGRADGLPPITVEEAGDEARPRDLDARASAELDAIAAGVAAMADAPGGLVGFRWWLTRAWALWQAAPAARMRAVHPAVSRAANALQRDPTLSLADLAGSAGLSVGRLGRLFREQTGKGIVRYRDEQKLDRVDRALQERPRANLLTVALDAGFGGYPQFYRTFRKLRGTSPFNFYRRTDPDLT